MQLKEYGETMNFKKYLFILMVFTVINLPVFSDHIPTESDTAMNIQGRVAVIGNVNNWNPYLEVSGRLHTSTLEIDYGHLLAGSYYRVHKNIKVGAFYMLQTGVRHDDDWVSLNPGWEWKDTARRLENSLILDITPRYLVPWINKNSVTSIKFRYMYNFFNDHQTLLIKPGVNYFHLINRKPVWSASLAYSFYIPLNFSESVLYEHGPYINFIYHLSKLIKLELKTSFHFITWTTGKDSLADGDSYSINENAFNLGIGIIFTL